MHKAANEGDVTRLIRSFGLRAFRYRSFGNRPTRPWAEAPEAPRSAVPEATAAIVDEVAPPAAAIVPPPALAPATHAQAATAPPGPRPAFTLLQQALAGIAPPSGPRLRPAPTDRRFTLLPPATRGEMAGS